MDVFKLSRNFFDWSFENPEKITPTHTALYFFSIEHCNRLGWKKKFGFPTEMAKDAIGIKSYNTYIKVFNDLVDWGFFELIERSKNQYSANIIALPNFDKATDKALDKAMIKHKGKQSESTSESIDSIDIHNTNIQETNKQVSKDTEQAPIVAIIEKDVRDIETSSTYGKEELNMMQGYLRKAVGVTQFKDSKERWYVSHCYNLLKKIGREEFEHRLKAILEDDFKSKNCNKLAYLYGELKSYIHSPIVETKSKHGVF